MFTVDNFCLLDCDEYVEITNTTIIREEQRDFIMQVTIETEGKSFFDLFCKKNDKGKRIEESKIKYLTLNNFPDGILMEIQREKVVFHIFELKKTPQNQLLKIGKQFHSASMHIESICANLGIAKSDCDVKYYVGYATDDVHIQKEFNQLSQTGRKILHGVENDSVTRSDKWVNNIVYNKISHINFEVDVTKIQIPFQRQIHNTEIYDLTLTL